MTKTYAIEKKTQNSAWTPIHTGLADDTAMTILTNIIFAYESIAEDEDYEHTNEMFVPQLYEDGYISTTVDDGEDGECGDYIISYRIVKEA